VGAGCVRECVCVCVGGGGGCLRPVVHPCFCVCAVGSFPGAGKGMIHISGAHYGARARGKGGVAGGPSGDDTYLT
jgi:hypothetical protein